MRSTYTDQDRLRDLALRLLRTTRNPDRAGLQLYDRLSQDPRMVFMVMGDITIRNACIDYMRGLNNASQIVEPSISETPLLLRREHQRGPSPEAIQASKQMMARLSTSLLDYYTLIDGRRLSTMTKAQVRDSMNRDIKEAALLRRILDFAPANSSDSDLVRDFISEPTLQRLIKENEESNC